MFIAKSNKVECHIVRILLDVDQSRISHYTPMDASSNSVEYRSNMAIGDH
jgi:hypothetical protein